jgi:hypothetical protein
MNQTTEAREVITEATVTTDPAMTAIVERLRQERDLLEREEQRIEQEKQEKIDKETAEYLAYGQSCGLEWVKTASYADLLYAKNNLNEPGTTAFILAGYRFSEKKGPWQDFLKDVFQQDPNLQIDVPPPGPGPNRLTPRNHQTKAWIEGWYTGIMAIFNEV